MPHSPKPPISPAASTDDTEVRRRVGRACQRCRLKKCKCNGATPCTRCKSDDAICAYGRPKRSDKIIFRSGYVQMLERQQSQLVAGLQELYRRTQNGEGWPGDRLELERHNQPLTHKILEALGVLRPGVWKETENIGNPWQWVEKRRPDDDDEDDGCTYPVYGSPSTQSTCTYSPHSPTQSSTFAQSTIMLKRRLKLQTGLATMAPPAQQHTLSMPPPFIAGLAPIKPEGHTNPFPTPKMTLSDMSGPYNQMMAMGLLDRASGSSTMDWSFGMDDVFANLGAQEPSVLQGCLQH